MRGRELGARRQRCCKFRDKFSEVSQPWGQVVRGVEDFRTSGQRYCRFSDKFSELLLSNMMYRLLEDDDWTILGVEDSRCVPFVRRNRLGCKVE